jgi:hypothetical protein
MQKKSTDLKRNPTKFCRKKLKMFDESGPKATSSLNFGGEEAFQSEYPALFFLLARGLVILRLLLLLRNMFMHREPIYQEGFYGVDLEEIGYLNAADELDFDLAVAITN